MSLGNNIKKAILDKSDQYIYYKTQYEYYKFHYQKLVQILNSDKQLVEFEILNSKLIAIKEHQKLLEKKLVELSENKHDFLLEDINNNDILFDSMKFNNLKLLDQNRYLINENHRLQKMNKSLYDLNEKLLNKSHISDNDILELYEDELSFYKKEYEYLLRKQKEHELLFKEIFDFNFNHIIEKQQFFEKTLNEDFSNLNIAYVLAGFPTLSETFILNELRWLKQNGYNVKVFSYYNPQKPASLDFDIEVYRFDGDLLNNLEKLLIEHKIDIMHTHFVYPVGTQLTHPLAEKLKIPFTLFAHAYDIFIKENVERNNVAKIAKSEYCKGIFTLSNYHKNYLMKCGVPENKIIITRQATEYTIQPLKQKNKKIKNIISISRFVEKKGIDTIIDAAKLLENEDLNFSIYGYGVLEEKIKNKINDLHLSNTNIKGSLNGSTEVKKVFDNSDLLVAPCRIAENGDRDGIPTVIFESMAYGVPVLTTNISAIPEVITDNVNGFLIEPNNPEQLKNKIKEIMKLPPQQLLKIRKNAQIDVQTFSSIPKTTNTLLNTWTN